MKIIESKQGHTSSSSQQLLLEGLRQRSRVSLVVEHSSANPKVPVQFRARSHTGVMDYDEACFMHLTLGVVHNFPKAVGVWDFCPICTKRSQVPIQKEKGATPGILVSHLNNRW